MAKRCGENDVDLGDIVQIVQDYQRAFMTEVAKARMVRSKGKYSLIQKYRTEIYDEMAQELFNKVVGPSHSDIEERARQEREREELESPVRMQGQGSARPPRVLDADSKLEDMQDNLEGLEEEERGGEEVLLKDQETAAPRDAPGREDLEVQLEEYESAAPRHVPGREDEETAAPRDVPDREEEETAAPRQAGREELEV